MTISTRKDKSRPLLPSSFPLLWVPKRRRRSWSREGEIRSVNRREFPRCSLKSPRSHRIIRLKTISCRVNRTVPTRVYIRIDETSVSTLLVNSGGSQTATRLDPSTVTRSRTHCLLGKEFLVSFFFLSTIKGFYRRNFSLPCSLDGRRYTPPRVWSQEDEW